MEMCGGQGPDGQGREVSGCQEEGNGSGPGGQAVENQQLEEAEQAPSLLRRLGHHWFTWAQTGARSGTSRPLDPV